MKFEAVRIHLFLFFCHPKILLTWKRDVPTSPPSLFQLTYRRSQCILEDPGAVSLAGRKGVSKFSSTGGRAPGYLIKHNSRRVRTHEKNSRDAVRRLGTIIQSIFCAQSGASLRLTVWKQSGGSRYSGALPPVLEIPNIPQLPVNVLINELMNTSYHYINLQFMKYISACFDFRHKLLTK